MYRQRPCGYAILACFVAMAAGCSAEPARETGEASEEEAAAALSARVRLPEESMSLDEPETDESIVVDAMETAAPIPVRERDQFAVAVAFEAPNRNVVGAGIRFGESGPIRVVSVPDAEGLASGVLEFDVEMPADICDELASICHDIKCYEFAVTAEGKISRANITPMAMVCGGCDEPSCKGLLADCGHEPGGDPFRRVTQLSAGEQDTCALRSDGTVVCWGSDSSGQSTPPAATSPFTQITTGYYHTCGLMVDGTIECWGSNEDSNQSTPPAGTFTEIDAGSYHSCGLKRDGVVECWGANDEGQATPLGEGYVQVGAGGNFSCGLRRDGTIRCWGGETEGGYVPPTGTFVEISVGSGFACALDIDGLVSCWGKAPSPDPFGVASPPPGSFTQVDVGHSHVCALRIDGTIVCWGDSENGEGSPPDGAFAQIAVGSFHGCGIRMTGDVECWGGNFYGESTPPVELTGAP